MNDQPLSAPELPNMTAPQPNVEQPNAQPSVAPAQPAAPVAPPPIKKPLPILPIVGGILVLVIVVVAGMAFSTRTNTGTQTQVVPTPTLAVSPTPVQNLSKLATTAAFLDFSSENASFAGILNTFVLQDPTLSPPVLDTEVQFIQ